MQLDENGAAEPNSISHLGARSAMITLGMVSGRTLRSTAVLAIVVSAATVGSASAAATIKVGATQAWAPTGIAVEAGQLIRTRATGTINYCGGAQQCTAGPDGSAETHCGSAGGPTSVCGRLVGRIGGSAFEVGSDSRVTAPASGVLELGVQDFHFDDNSGSFTAIVEIDPVEKDPKPGSAVGTVAYVKSLGNGKPSAQVFRNGKWRTLKAGDDLGEDARVRTNRDTTVVIMLALGGKVLLRPESNVRIGERSVSGTEKPWKLTKGGVWASCGRMSDNLEIQMTGGGVIGIKDPSRGGPRRLRAGRPQVGTITSAGPSGTLQVTPKGGVAAPAQQGQELRLGDLLNPSPGAAASLQLTRPSSVAKSARLVKIEPQSGGKPIVGIDRVGAVLNVSITDSASR